MPSLCPRHARLRTSSTRSVPRTKSPGKTIPSPTGAHGPSSICTKWTATRSRSGSIWPRTIRYGTTWARRQPTQGRSTPKIRQSLVTTPRATISTPFQSRRSLPLPPPQRENPILLRVLISTRILRPMRQPRRRAASRNHTRTSPDNQATSTSIRRQHSPHRGSSPLGLPLQPHSQPRIITTIITTKGRAALATREVLCTRPSASRPSHLNITQDIKAQPTRHIRELSLLMEIGTARCNRSRNHSHSRNNKAILHRVVILHIVLLPSRPHPLRQHRTKLQHSLVIRPSLHGKYTSRYTRSIPSSRCTTTGMFHIPARIHPYSLRIRESSKYRTPYSPWGGFTNGYEGDLRAHLMANPQELMRRSSMTSGSPPSMSNVARPPGTQHPAPNGNTAMPSASPSMAQGSFSGPPRPQQQSQISPPIPSGSVGQQVRPISRPDQSSRTQQTPQSQAQNQAASKPKPAAAPKSYKLPPKESPVPLPANFLAAMNSSPGASPSASKPPPAQATAQASVTTGAQLGHPTAASPQPSVTVDTPGSAGSRGDNNAAKFSTTPVPVPKFPVMTPHQAAARAVASQPMESKGPNTQQVRGAPLEPVSVTPNAEKPTLSAEGDVPMTGTLANQVSAPGGTLEFADVPGSESMEFMEKMMANLRRVVQSSSRA